MSNKVAPVPHTISHAELDMLPEDAISQRIENYIPLRFPDVRERLIEDFPDYFNMHGMAEKFRRVGELMSLRNKLRLHELYGDFEESYAFIDPDCDKEMPRAGARLTPDAKKALLGGFESTFWSILEKGGFERLPDEHLLEATKASTAMGMQVRQPSTKEVQYECFYRGLREKTVRVGTWRTLFIPVATKLRVYQRFALMFRLLPPSPPSCFGLTGGSEIGIPEDQNPDLVYLKLFKDIGQDDVDMLLPGSRVKFTWLDYLLILGPIFFGFGSALFKAVQGTVDFSTQENIITTILLVFLPVSWGIRGYMAMKKKAYDYQAQLATLWLLHNLNNNKGVIEQLIDEAEEQEDNEALLAYFFLWRGSQQPAPVSKPELDRAVEEWLNGVMQEQKLKTRIDFEVTDSIDKLQSLGLLKVLPGAEGGSRNYQVENLDRALAILSEPISLRPRPETPA